MPSPEINMQMPESPMGEVRGFLKYNRQSYTQQASSTRLAGEVENRKWCTKGQIIYWSSVGKEILLYKYSLCRKMQKTTVRWWRKILLCQLGKPKKKCFGSRQTRLPQGLAAAAWSWLPVSSAAVSLTLNPARHKVLRGGRLCLPPQDHPSTPSLMLYLPKEWINS